MLAKHVAVFLEHVPLLFIKENELYTVFSLRMSTSPKLTHFVNLLMDLLVRLRLCRCNLVITCPICSISYQTACYDVLM